ncbi:hypothetical protein ACFWR9_10675 [Streptomyces sp. NPDC058534]|uniref:hypothetical protein n=1 Tax=Streptomyces sp. NPDC058534 TaxID=3346541 RepID=UPI0036623E3D
MAGAGPDRGTARWTGVPDAVLPPDGEEVPPWGGVAGVVGVPVDAPLPGAGAGRFDRGDTARWTGVPEEAPPPEGRVARCTGGSGGPGVPEAALSPDGEGDLRTGALDAAPSPEEVPPPEGRVARCTGGAGGPGVPEAALSPDGEADLRTGALDAAPSPEEAGGRGTDRWTAGVSVAAGPCCCGRTARCTGGSGDAGGDAGVVAAVSPPDSGAGAAGPAGAEPGSARSPAPDEGAVPEDFGGVSAVRRVEGRARRCTGGDPDGALVSGCRGRGGAGGTGVTRTPRAACADGFTGAADEADPVERDR